MKVALVTETAVATMGSSHTVDYRNFTSACVYAESVTETVVATKGVFTLPTTLPSQVPMSVLKVLQRQW